MTLSISDSAVDTCQSDVKIKTDKGTTHPFKQIMMILKTGLPKMTLISLFSSQDLHSAH